MKQFGLPLLLCFSMVLFSVQIGLAQGRDIEIANEYYNGGEFEKALDMYERLAKKDENLPSIYSPYLALLRRNSRLEDAEKIIRKMIKLEQDNLKYKLDHYLLSREMFGEDKSSKEFNAIVNEVKANEILSEKTADMFIENGYTELALQLLIASRKAIKNNDLYVYLIASVYSQQGNTANAIDELLNFITRRPEEIENVKNSLQNNLKDEKDFDLLEGNLYTLIQQNPDQIIYNELLLWLNLQKRNFAKAFLQAKAIDKRYKLQGAKMMEVGKVAYDNKDYESAVRFYEYVVKEHPDGMNYPLARKELIASKEEVVKNTFPIDSLKIISLIGDYTLLIREMGTNPATLDARRSLALLYAFYLNNKDTAITILNELINLSRANLRTKCRAKVDLGDIYLLKEEPWEATLLYSQVEKDMIEDPLGHEAKLKNAKLSYYKGDFELAQAHLDVLKLATSREISNDAMDLSIMIQDNIGLDSTTDAMKDYAAIDLLLFQNKTANALVKAELLLEKYPEHALTDEIFWLLSKIYLKTGDFQKAIKSLEAINAKYAEDILGDNALFTLGIIYEEKLKDAAKAMETYQQFLKNYSNSIYTVDARKRFRLLRGDKL